VADVVDDTWIHTSVLRSRDRIDLADVDTIEQSWGKFIPSAL